MSRKKKIIAKCSQMKKMEASFTMKKMKNDFIIFILRISFIQFLFLIFVKNN